MIVDSWTPLKYTLDKNTINENEIVFLDLSTKTHFVENALCSKESCLKEKDCWLQS